MEEEMREIKFRGKMKTHKVDYNYTKTKEYLGMSFRCKELVGDNSRFSYKWKDVTCKNCLKKRVGTKR